MDMATYTTGIVTKGPVKNFKSFICPIDTSYYAQQAEFYSGKYKSNILSYSQIMPIK